MRVSREPLEQRVLGLLRNHPAVRSVELVGSRAEGRANERSDWDFRVVTDAFERLAPELPALLAPLAPIAQQWDRLSDHPCWMLMLPGPVKIDLIFAEETQELGPPWTPTADNLPDIDAHFWDWILWLGSKEASGKRELLQRELQKLFDYLLEQLGADRPPASIAGAIAAYREARDGAEARFGVKVPRTLEAEVVPALENS
jgi:predicted nucleotidyltransferase